MLETIRLLFEYNEWANARILDAHVLSPNSGKRSMDLLAHLLMSEKIWLMRIKDQDTMAINKSPRLSHEQCRALALENQTAYAGLFSSCSENDLRRCVKYKNFKGVEFETAIGDILMHVALHGTYHRGQIASAMRAQGDTPADTDFITFVRGRIEKL
jgi:uncharacterized damage-inducible protein DinB